MDNRKNNTVLGETPRTHYRREETIHFSCNERGSRRQITVLKFGEPGARPKAYLQAGLHADELPGMLVLQFLANKLEVAAARGAIEGEIVIVPTANPIGLAQRNGDYLSGRFDSSSGENFNRNFPDATRAVADKVGAKLGNDAQKNTKKIRKAMGKVLAIADADTELKMLRKALMILAHDADIALDLHADNEAQLHLYIGTPLWPDAMDLAAEIDARAVLLAEDSGGNCFDEACGGPWWALAKQFPEAAIPPACLAATVELRSNNDVSAEYAERDARALFRFLVRRGIVAGEAGSVPRLLCEATPLEAMQQVKAATDGLVVYKARLGDTVRDGEVVAEIFNASGDQCEVKAHTDGLLFALHDQRYAWEGKIIGKIAGKHPLPERSGNLLSP
ncbi:MAG: succinylglutamate desuccinylase/aspartoacylase family protein [Marinicaulis sp.]|nr:succinylglutamate desuccinylase/aspartoacylase family protein [Marinicaulis sp.]